MHTGSEAWTTLPPSCDAHSASSLRGHLYNPKELTTPTPTALQATLRFQEQVLDRPGSPRKRDGVETRLHIQDHNKIERVAKV